MSYGVMVYLVDTEQMFRWLKTEQSILTKIKRKCFGYRGYPEWLLRESEETISNLNASLEESGEQIRAEELLMEIVDGKANRAYLGHAYGYLFEAICQCHGEFLNNSEWFPCSLPHFYELPFSTTDLPLNFACPGDFPAIRSVRPGDIDWDNGDFSSYDPKQVEQFRAWCTAAQETDQDLFLFLY